MTKKQEQSELEAKDVEIAQLTQQIHDTKVVMDLEHEKTKTELAQAVARISNLEQQNKSLRNLMTQIRDIFMKEDGLMRTAAGDLESGDKVLAGMKLRELSEVISDNYNALDGIIKEWEKE